MGKKSDLQIELEKQGWELLTNEHIIMESTREIPFNLKERDHPKSDSEIKNEYLKKGFKEVKISDAYTFEGEFIKDHRAVYIKR